MSKAFYCKKTWQMNLTMLRHDINPLIAKFEELQEEREYAYRHLTEGHVVYLSGKPNYDFITYSKLVKEATIEFKRISSEISAVESELRHAYKLPEVADYINQIQDADKSKLKIIARIQILKQNFIEEIDQFQKEIFQANRELIDIDSEIHEYLTSIKTKLNDILN